MPEPDDKKIDDGNKDDKGEEKKPELTLESVKELVVNLKTEQAEAIKAIKTESINNIAQLKQTIQDRDDDIQNLTNLLGGLAKPDADGNKDDVDLTIPENIEKLVDKRVADGKQAETEASTKESKAYWKEYGEIAQEHMDEEGPDGKPLSKEAREGIKQLMIDTPADRTKNATRDAQRGFRKASRVFFGLDKTHGFKGGDVSGTGGGGTGENKNVNKKVYKLTDESKKALKDLGETEEWGQEQLRKRAEEEQLA